VAARAATRVTGPSGLSAHLRTLCGIVLELPERERNMSVDVTPFRRAGLAIDGDEFIRRVMAAAIRMLPSRPIQDTRADLSEEEAAFLRDAGVDLSVFSPTEQGAESPLARTAEEYAALVATSLSIAELASRLGIHPSRLRHRLAEHTVFGIKDGATWRLPLFQLDDSGQHLVPGLDQVAPTWSGVHPIAVRRWFLEASSDLRDPSGHPTSPRDWLLSGGDPQTVVELAAELHADG